MDLNFDSRIAVMQPAFEGFNAVGHLDHHFVGNLTHHFARLGIAHSDHGAAQGFVNTNVEVAPTVFEHGIEAIDRGLDGLLQALQISTHLGFLAKLSFATSLICVTGAAGGVTRAVGCDAELGSGRP